MDILRLVLLVLIGGLIGWITNKVAIKMLFRPVNPVRILIFTIQGVFPKRKDKMAVSLAEIIERELLSKEVLMNKILNEEKVAELKEVVKDSLKERITKMIPPMIAMFMGGDPEAVVSKLVDREGDKILDGLVEDLKDKALDNFSIYEIVKDRVDSLDFVEFEKLIFGLMKDELRFVELVGLILGSLIGLIQYFVTIWV